MGSSGAGGGEGGRGRRRRALLLAVAAALLLSGGAAYRAGERVWRGEAVDPRSLDAPSPPAVFTDRHGAILRVLSDGNGDRVLPVPLSAVPRHVRDAFVTAEDKRFFSHRGFDPLAMARAARDCLAAGRIVSGASTITQQLARMTRPRGETAGRPAGADGRRGRERTFSAKLREVVRAVRIEALLPKEEILSAYLNRVPLGRNVRGVEAASRAYFGKGVSELTPLEGAVLASIPRSPARLDPYGPGADELLARGRRLVSRMAAAGLLPPGEAERARSARVEITPFGLPFRAPHLVDRLVADGVPSPGVHRTTLDLAVQRTVEETLRSHATRLATRGVAQGAAIVVRNDTREVLAYVGSLAYAPEGAGFCDGARTRRSAGSTLKPFLYARAIEAGHSSSTLVKDTARRYRSPRGDFSPDNFDRVEYGPVTMRVALANSLNLSAVATLDRLGPAVFYRTLSDLSLPGERCGGAERLGLGMAVGNAEVTLEGLAGAYAALAAGGTWKPLRFTDGDSAKGGRGRRVFFPETAFIVTDILSDPAARMLTFGAGFPGDVPFPYALKTGTSSRFRDGWAVAYTTRHTVAVWVGNFDGSPTEGISGGWGAAPVAGEILRKVQGKGVPPRFRPPPGVASVPVCGISGMAPSPGCAHVTREWFVRGAEPASPCTLHAGGRAAHLLPAPYARWVAERERRGAAGRFALEGGLSIAGDDPFPEGEGAVGGGTGEGGNTDGTADGTTDGEEAPFRGRLVADDAGDAPRAAPAGRGAPALEIAYPLPRDRFVLDRAAPAPAIRLDAVVPSPVPFVEWYVDGRLLARSAPPYSAWWTLFPGTHRITATAPGLAGESVRVAVE